MKNKYDYTGKSVFVGIDVHKKTYAVTAICDGQQVKKDTLSACPKKLLSYLIKFFAGAQIFSAYEAGFSGFGLHRFLVKAGVENIVVHAASIEIGARDRVKTDKRDSLKIAIQLAAGRLKGIYVPDEDQEDRRTLTRLRATLVKDRNRVAVRLKHQGHFHGLLSFDDNQKVCSKWIARFQKIKVGAGLRYALDYLIDQWHSLSLKVKEIDQLLVEQAANDSELETVYRSTPGVGPTAARVLANELGNMSQFTSERALSSYTGLTPCEYSSGEHVRRGHISRQGKPMLRCILVQSAWVAIRYDPALRAIFERIALRAGKKRAIVAIARRLIGRIRACFNKGTLYQLGVAA